MRRRGRLRLTPEQMAFTLALCRELNRLGIPIEYGAFTVAMANWWVGNAEQRIPGDNDELADCLRRGVAAWKRKSAALDALPGFIIMEMKIFAANRPLTLPLREGGGEAALAETIRSWPRSRPGTSVTEVGQCSTRST